MIIIRLTSMIMVFIGSLCVVYMLVHVAEFLSTSPCSTGVGP